ncbi:MAG: GNAT family N-acetyltransferase, partial [Oscillospiraceae bacterium]|nr:GNAT family N-acetyltransferase [Oscillospiraceae bacterium]
MLELYEPQVEDLWFKEKMMGDEQTMSYNHAYGGIIPFPKEYWADWHDRWITNHNGKRFYRYIKDRDTFVGEVAYHFDGERKIYIADVIIYAPHRGKGYGRTGLLLLCENAKSNGIKELHD